MGETFMGVPREMIEWSPCIDYARCNYCMECVKFCPHKVYEVRSDEEVKLVVHRPYNCVVFCRACGKACGPDAISFPDKGDTARRIREIRKDMGGNG